MNSIILDADTGEDDALAILVAVCKKLPITHIISSFGNTTLEHSTRNAADILHLAKATHIEIIKGAAKPLKKHPFDSSTALAGDFVGKNGICDIQLEPNTSITVHTPSEKAFIKLVESVLKKNKKTDYIVTGPQTNLAILCKELGKKINDYIGTVYIMGAAIHVPGNSGPEDNKTKQQPAEFNIYCDPEAAEIVLHAGLPIKYITWDVCRYLTIPYKDVQRFTSNTPVGKFVVELMKRFLETYGLANQNDFELSDPITVLAAMGYGEYNPIKIEVIKNGNDYGKTIESKNGLPVEMFSLQESKKAIADMLDILTIRT